MAAWMRGCVAAWLHGQIWIIIRWCSGSGSSSSSRTGINRVILINDIVDKWTCASSSSRRRSPVDPGDRIISDLIFARLDLFFHSISPSSQLNNKLTTIININVVYSLEERYWFHFISYFTFIRYTPALKRAFIYTHELFEPTTLRLLAATAAILACTYTRVINMFD